MTTAVEVREVLALVGTRAEILNMPRDLDEGDVDCAIADTDKSWPLRLPRDWHLRQLIQYDITGYHWWLDHHRYIVKIDTLEDPLALGKYGFSTRHLTEELPQHTKDAIKAAYLAAKRTVKQDRSIEGWNAIATLRDRDRPRFDQVLRQVFGTRVGRAISVVPVGSAPSERLLRQARNAQRLQRVHRPDRALHVAAATLVRLGSRLRYPTGALVVLAGPDGAGKSMVRAALMNDLAPLFRETCAYHWRPGVLPRAGEVVRKPEPDATTPHGRETHGSFLSTGLLLYYWADFFIGGWSAWWSRKVRTQLVVVERGWDDLIVDPRRYRIDPPKLLIRALGRTLPRPDVFLLLDGSAATLMERKPELTSQEIERQNEHWKRLRGRWRSRRVVDVEQSPEQVAEAASCAVAEWLEQRAISRVAHGWYSPGESRRWWLPRGPRAVAKASLAIHQPMTTRALLAWQAAKAAASLGCAKASTRSTAPPRLVRELIAPYIPRHGWTAVARANHPGRYLVLTGERTGRARALVKVALEEPGRSALRREAENIVQLGALLPAGIDPPEILDQDEGVLVLRARSWRPRVRPWQLPSQVAAALGTLSHAAPSGASHGDAAPWNLLRTDDGWLLVDWEEAVLGGSPYFDLFHYLVQAHALLGNPSQADLLRALHGTGPAGDAVSAYCDAAGVPLPGPTALADYLHETRARLDPTQDEARRALHVRDALLATIESSIG
ncbi:MAG: hypothetical protein ABR575_10540 [Actinomycetota bacterium]